MRPMLKIENFHPAPESAQLNQEWVEVANEGEAPFSAEGCSITVAKGLTARQRVVTTMKAGVVISPGEHVRLVTGSAGKKSQGEAPADDRRNVFLFLKVPYLDRPGTVVRLVSRQNELCRATFGAD